MVTKNKKLSKKCDIGDTFAIEIKSDKYPEYNGKYLILTKSKYGDFVWDIKGYASFYVKITKTKEIPKTQEELDELEYIISSANAPVLEERYIAPGYEIPIPDQYGLIYSYSFSYMNLSRETINSACYLGNYPVKYPQNEYISSTGFRGEGRINKWTFPDEIIDCYNLYNLKQDDLYTKEGNELFHQRTQSEAQFYKEMLEREKLIFGHEEEYLAWMGIDTSQEEGEDSLTYVGPDKDEGTKKKS